MIIIVVIVTIIINIDTIIIIIASETVAFDKEYLHPWRSFRKSRSSSWKRKRTIRAWTKCRASRARGPEGCDQPTRVAIGSNTTRRLDTIVQDLRRSRPTRPPIGWRSGCRGISLPTFVRWHTSWKRAPTGGWSECCSCRRAWWGSYSAGHGISQIWWGDLLGSPAIKKKKQELKIEKVKFREIQK